MLKFLLKLIVSAGLLAILISHADIVALRNALAGAGWSQISCATLILFGTVPLLAWRWHIIAWAVGIPLSARSALIFVLIGTFFNQLLPSSIGGDAVRVWLLSRAHVPLTKSISSILLDRVVALFGMVLIVAIGFPWLMEILRQPILQTAAIGVVAAGFAGIALLLSLDKLPLPRVVRARLIVGKLLTLAVDARAVFLAPPIAASALFVSILIHLTVSIVVWTLARAIGVAVGFEALVLLLPLVLLLSLLPISIAGWGVREGAMIGCLALVGVDATSAFAISALFGLAGVIVGLPGGLAWLFFRGGRGTGNSSPPDKDRIPIASGLQMSATAADEEVRTSEGIVIDSRHVNGDERRRGADI